MTDNNVVCISHSKDADGLSSAALVKLITNADVILSDYGDYVDKLSGLEDIKELYICDLGLNYKTQDIFINEMKRISKEARITYVDHHPLDISLKKRIRRIGIKLIHSTHECASMLVLRGLGEKLSRDAGLIAAYGAVTDYMDDHPYAKKIINGFDRQFVLYESTVLSHAISASRGNLKQLMEIVDGLSNKKYPHQLKGVYNLARKQADAVGNLILKVGNDGHKMKNLAYMETEELSTGNVANLLIGAFNVDVGVAYRHHKGDGVYDVSLRGLGNSKKHLGNVVSSISKSLGGFGGGHACASGARFPQENLKRFLLLIDDELGVSH